MAEPQIAQIAQMQDETADARSAARCRNRINRTQRRAAQFKVQYPKLVERLAWPALALDCAVK